MGALNDGALCLMASIGHRTGLFDAMRDQPPQTSDEIASRAGLNERYVREWLGAMVTSGVIKRGSAKRPLPLAAGARGVPDAGGRRGQPGRFRAVSSRSSAMWRTTFSSASRRAAASRMSDSLGSMR